MLGQLVKKLSLLLVGVFFSSQAFSADFSEENYEVYFGDFNGDGKSGDVYFHEKDTFVLIHGDIAIPLIVASSGSYVVYEDGNGAAISLKKSSSELAGYLKGALRSNYIFRDLDGDGVQDIVAYAPDNNNVEVALTLSSGNPTAQVRPRSIATSAGNQPEDGPIVSSWQSIPNSSATIDMARPIPGQFEVSTEGQATYKIPVLVATGTNQNAPEISLNYSSGAGNGIVGYGWSLNAGGKIERCRQTFAIDGDAKSISLSKEDRFCLNGERLVPEGWDVEETYGEVGTRYRTEIDKYLRVISLGGTPGHPDYFVVEYKNGIKEIYGHRTSSSTVSAISESARELLDRGDTKTAVRWHLFQSFDRYSSVYYYYIHDDDGHRLDRIEFAVGGNSYSDYGAQVKFNYESRNDPINAYISGYETKINKRLQSIVSYNENQEIRRYKLTYNEGSAAGANDALSRVNQIQECVGSVCSRPTDFNWVLPLYGFEDSFTDIYLSEAPYSLAFGDVTGDGLNELVARMDGGTRIYRGAFDGTNYSWIESHAFSNGSLVSDGIGDSISFMDVNGDGMQDLALSQSSLYGSGGESTSFFLNVPVNTSSGIEWRISSDLHFKTGFNEVAVDINGDGLIDKINVGGNTIDGPDDSYSGGGFVYYSEIADLSNVTSKSYYQFGPAYQVSHVFPEGVSAPSCVYTGNSWCNINPWSSRPLQAARAGAGDLNGDGRVDLFVQTQDGYEDYDPGDGEGTYDVDEYSGGGAILYKDRGKKLYIQHFASGGGYGDSREGFTQTLLVRDSNNDGLSDAFGISDGVKAGVSPSGFGRDVSAKYGLITDLNLDGIPDFLGRREHNSDLGRGVIWGDLGGPQIPGFPEENRAAFFFDPIDRKMVSDRAGLTEEDEHKTRFADANNDGILDYIKWRGADPNDGKVSIRFGLSAGAASNKITAITNGLGSTIEIDYEQLDKTDHYTGLQEALTSAASKEKCAWFTDDYDEDYYKCWTESVPEMDVDAYYKAVNKPWSYLDGEDDYLDLYMPTFSTPNSMPVVTNVSISSPAADPSTPHDVDENAKQTTLYYYESYRSQASGRGSLGFRKFTTVDKETGVRSTTEFRQDWPYTGKPRIKTVKTKDGDVLKYERFFWDYENDECLDSSGIMDESCVDDFLHVVQDRISYGTNRFGSVRVSLSNRITKNYQLNTEPGYAATSLKNRIDEYFEYDAKGNTTFHRSETRKTDNINQVPSLRIQVTNEISYLSNSFYPLYMGKVTNKKVVSETPDNSDYDPVRNETEYTYYTDADEYSYGELKDVIVEPNNEKYKAVSTYSYEDYGPLFAIRTTADGQTRTQYVRYDSRYRYPDKEYGTVNLDENPNTGTLKLRSQVVNRDKYGNPTEIRRYTDADSYAREIKATTPFGTVYYHADSNGNGFVYDAGLGLDSDDVCPSYTRRWTKIKELSGGMRITCFDVLEREVRVADVGFNGEWIFVDTEYSRSGAVVHKSQPYFKGKTAYWTTNADIDALGRAGRILHPKREDDGLIPDSLITYYGNSTKLINEEDQQRIETKDARGLVYKVTDALNKNTYFYYDSAKRLTGMSRSDGTYTEINYDVLGRRTFVSDPDKGSWSFRYNKFGEEICRMSAENLITQSTYDINGRLHSRMDRNAGGNCSAPAGAITQYSEWTYDTQENGYWQLANRFTGATSNKSTAGFSETYFYDILGRETEVHTSIAGHNNSRETHFSKTTYDAFGRVDKYYDAARSSQNYLSNGVRNIYSKFGYLSRVEDAHSSIAYLTIEQADEWGNIKTASYGNGVMQQTTHWSDSGLAKHHSVYVPGGGSGSRLQNIDYKWDAIGNLSSRHETGAGTYYDLKGDTRDIFEVFFYDDLNRLTDWNTSGKVNDAESAVYNDIGNILSKTSFGQSMTYKYGSECSHSGSLRHAVCQTSIGGNTTNYYYDKNGSLTSDGTGRSVSYTVYDKPASISKAGHTTSFSYGPDRARYKRVDVSEGKTTTTLQLGSVEKIYYPDSSVDWKRHIAGVAMITQTFNSGSSNSSETRYLHYDHLGSLNLITDGVGGVWEELYFDPWGKSREPGTGSGGWVDDKPFIKADKPVASRGFTDHEMLDEVGLIHMNGRIYDPILARFVQSDPLLLRISTGALNLDNDERVQTHSARSQSKGSTGYDSGDVVSKNSSNAQPSPLSAKEHASSDTASGGRSLGSIAANRDPLRSVRSFDYYDRIDSSILRAGTLGYADHLNVYSYTYNNPLNAIDPTGEFANFVVKFAADVALGAALNYMETGEMNLGAAFTDAAIGVVNPAKTLQKVKRIAKVLKKAPCGCFVEGTQVLTDEGLKDIEELEVGDIVWAKDTKSGDKFWKPVIDFFVIPNREIYELNLVTESGEMLKISVSDDHPFYVVGDGWKETLELVTGDYIETEGHGTAMVVSLVDQQRTDVTYNFTVADFHTYYVTEKNILVHNCGSKGKGKVAKKAEAARDALANEKRRKHATYAGGHKDGKTVAGCSSNPSGCAEDDIARQLGSDAQMTGAKGFRRNEATGELEYTDIPVCTNCQSKYNKSQFPSDVRYDPDGAWSE